MVSNIVNLPADVLAILCRDLSYWEIGHHPNYSGHQTSSKDAIIFSTTCTTIRYVFQNVCEEFSVTVTNILMSYCAILSFYNDNYHAIHYFCNYRSDEAKHPSGSDVGMHLQH